MTAAATVESVVDYALKTLFSNDKKAWICKGVGFLVAQEHFELIRK